MDIIINEVVVGTEQVEFKYTANCEEIINIQTIHGDIITLDCSGVISSIYLDVTDDNIKYSSGRIKALTENNVGLFLPLLLPEYSKDDIDGEWVEPDEIPTINLNVVWDNDLTSGFPDKTSIRVYTDGDINITVNNPSTIEKGGVNVEAFDPFYSHVNITDSNINVGEHKQCIGKYQKLADTCSMSLSFTGKINKDISVINYRDGGVSCFDVE